MDRTQLINNLYTNDLELNPSNNEILIANLIIRESSTTQDHVNWIEPQLIKHKANLTEYITLFNSSERTQQLQAFRTETINTADEYRIEYCHGRQHV